MDMDTPTRLYFQTKLIENRTLGVVPRSKAGRLAGAGWRLSTFNPRVPTAGSRLELRGLADRDRTHHAVREVEEKSFGIEDRLSE